MPAIKVFELSIKFLVEDLMQKLKNSYTGIKKSDVEFVITVPAIWDDRSKQFMREAAKGVRNMSTNCCFFSFIIIHF